MYILHKTGDVLAVKNDSVLKVIPHVCNNVGAWGEGFVTAISKRWSLPEKAFKNTDPVMGNVTYILVEPNIYVINMIAQNGLISRWNKQPLNYEVLRTCLIEVNKFLVKYPVSEIHMPKIGCGLAGGSWDKVSEIITEVFKDTNVTVFVYTLEGV